jgi:hypothetical protein
MVRYLLPFETEDGMMIGADMRIAADTTIGVGMMTGADETTGEAITIEEIEPTGADPDTTKL